MNNQQKYKPIKNLKIQKEKTVLISSYPQHFSFRTNFYYQQNKLFDTIQSAIELGKNTFISCHKSLFEVLSMGEILSFKEKYPSLKVYHVCFTPPEKNSLGWDEYTEFSRFCVIQNQLDGSFYFTKSESTYNKFLEWLIENASLMIGYFSIQEFMSSTIIKLAKEMDCQIVNLYDDRMNFESIGGGMPYELLPLLQDKELQKAISLNYKSYYGATIRGTVFGDPLYHNIHTKKSKIIQQLLASDISINAAKKLMLELIQLNNQIMNLIADTAYKIGNSTDLSEILSMPKNRKSRGTKNGQ